MSVPSTNNGHGPEMGSGAGTPTSERRRLSAPARARALSRHARRTGQATHLQQTAHVLEARGFKLTRGTTHGPQLAQHELWPSALRRQPWLPLAISFLLAYALGSWCSSKSNR